MSDHRPLDLLLLHAPSVYDFRKKSIFYGPVSDLIPSSTVFEMYPAGFLTISSYLKAQGIRVRIVNLAVRMMKDRKFSVPEFLRSQRPRAVGIDLHWLPHAHGALEVARIVKEIHPRVPVIFGGLSSTYFHEELMHYNQVDYVLRGDSTEVPLHQLLTALRDGGSLEKIPNLTYRQNGLPRVNPLTFLPPGLDFADLRADLMVEMVLRHRDLASVVPYVGWTRNPITAVFTVKGCAHECATCGSSHTTCGHLTHRIAPVFRSPENLAKNMIALSRFSRGPIFLVGDLLQAGRDYADAVLEELRRANLENQVVFEFFDVPPIDFLRRIDASTPHWSLELSPESHDHDVRRAQDGEPGYDNEMMEAALREALHLRTTRIDVFFMIGLPRQTYQSVLDTIAYCERLFQMSDRRLSCFISPMGPFLDPGSRVFEEPKKFGYRVFARTLEDHRKLLVEPSWEKILSYETEWMTRAELVDATYDAGERLNQLKLKYGRIRPRRAHAVAERIRAARDLRRRIAEGSEIADLEGEIEQFSESTVCDKRELFWARHLINFRIAEILRIAGRYYFGSRRKKQDRLMA
ncbi:MAG TPA: TIGR04190 family B12-binding domain/radical SAM domain protein [Bryobacteraceae bacterium]|nr:TIGR04190 family B12-binding domain/radical SAM domain protein [Bryobacteraceae bacterium]